MNRASRTLLIVDDSPEDQELYWRYLRRDREYDYTILEATLGQQGLDLWQQHRPDVVLLDYRLPDLDGLEFLSRLQSSTQELCLPVIVVTGQGNEAIAVQAMKAGAQDYLVKGQITPEGLQLAVNGAIEVVQLRTQLQQRIDREHVVAQITRQIHQSLDLDEILQTTVAEVRHFLHTDRVLIFQLEPDGNGTVVAESVGSQWRSLLSSTIHDPCLAENYLRFNRPESETYAPALVDDYVKRYRQGQITAIADIQDTNIDPCHVELLAQFHVKANLVVPILHEDQFWGLLIAHHCATPRAWQPLEIDLLKELVTQVSIALRQAELYQQAQHELAERQQIEAVLRESEERLRLALEASRMGTWDWNIQTGQISWSENLEALFGLEPGEFDGSYEMFVSRLHPDDRDRVLAAVDHAITTGEDYDFEFRVVYPNGTIRWALTQGKVFYDLDRQPIRMAGIDVDITERKRSEAALQDSEERFRTSVENMLDSFGIYLAVRNEQGQIVDFRTEYLNEAACLNNQMTREQQLGQGLCELLPGHRGSGLFDEYCQVVETGQSLVKDSLVYEDEYGQQHLIRAFDIRVAKFGDGFVATWRDITERKHTEEALRENEQLLRLALAGAHAGSWDWEIQTDKIFWSPENFDLYGLDLAKGSPQYKDWYNALHPDDRERTNTEVASVVEERLPEFRSEFRIIHPQRGICWLLALGRLTLNEQGEPIRLSGINLDITDRKQVEESLRQSEERYRTLFESMEDGFCVIEMLFNENNMPIDYRFLEINPAFEQQTGLEQAVGKTARQLVPTLEDYWFETYGRVALTGEPVRFENSSEELNRWFDVYAFRIGQPKSRKVAILFKDISDRKLAEEEREKLLANEQSARAEAERANRIKDEFLAVLSHELRSPLNPILGWTKLLQTRRFDETKTAEALATIERNAKLQTQLIDDLLDVAKILRGKLSMDSAPINLTFVIESAIDTVRTAAVSKSILLHPVLLNIGQVSGDSTRLQQIVWNLLSNAIKFTPKGGQVEIRLERVDDQAQIIVSDTGKGINREFLPYIFESFRQEDVSTTRKYGGLGLGLAIVRHLVEAHGGTISADSPGEGQGATFTVRLPLLNLEPEPTQSHELLEQEPDLTGIRVLTVDDDRDARELLTVLLTEYGAEVVTVSSAAEVFKALESFQPDILVSDIGMPELDGYTLLQKLRSLPPEKGGQLPAIALTAYAGEVDQQRALTVGFGRHITKPIEPNQLAQAVATLVRANV